MMTSLRSLPFRDKLALTAALVAPLGICALLVPFRRSVANTDAALVLVLVVVAVAANGQRAAGLLTSLSAAVWFDFFLTRPYESFAITHRDDVETGVLLLVIGAAVSELAVWARRQQALVSAQAGYLEGIHDAAEAAASGRSEPEVIDLVSRQLRQLLGLDTARFQRGVAGLGNPPRLLHDGRVVVDRAEWDADARGLPPGTETELIVESGGVLSGRYLLAPHAGARPTRAQRLVAVALADQTASAIARREHVAE
jgi:K+-sensing histidine kinase KdpD